MSGRLALANLRAGRWIWVLQGREFIELGFKSPHHDLDVFGLFLLGFGIEYGYAAQNASSKAPRVT